MLHKIDKNMFVINCINFEFNIVNEKKLTRALIKKTKQLITCKLHILKLNILINNAYYSLKDIIFRNITI